MSGRGKADSSKATDANKHLLGKRLALLQHGKLLSRVAHPSSPRPSVCLLPHTLDAAALTLRQA